jgi:hypothetical protein
VDQGLEEPKEEPGTSWKGCDHDTFVARAVAIRRTTDGPMSMGNDRMSPSV